MGETSEALAVRRLRRLLLTLVVVVFAGIALKLSLLGRWSSSPGSSTSSPR